MKIAVFQDFFRKKMVGMGLEGVKMGKCFGSLKPPTLLIIPIILISEMPFLGQKQKIWIRAGLQHLGEVFPLNQFI